jgi:hypothetical protein
MISAYPIDFHYPMHIIAFAMHKYAFIDFYFP